MHRIYLCLVLLFIAVNVSAQENEHYQTALTHAESKQYKLALSEIELAINEDPKRSSFRLFKSKTHANLEEFDAAMNTINTAILLMSDSAELYGFRGSLYEAFRRFDYAIADFDKAFTLSDDPKDKCVYLSLKGGTKGKIRDFNGAYNDLIESLEYDPENLNALNNLAAICDEVDKPDETIFYLNKVIALDSTYASAYINLGFKYQINGDHEKALINFNKAEKLVPQDPLVYSNRAFTYLQLNDSEKALKDINHSLELFPFNSYAYKIRALIYLAQKNNKEACNDLFKAIELDYTDQYGNEVKDLILNHCE